MPSFDADVAHQLVRALDIQVLIQNSERDLEELVGVGSNIGCVQVLDLRLGTPQELAEKAMLICMCRDSEGDGSRLVEELRGLSKLSDASVLMIEDVSYLLDPGSAIDLTVVLMALKELSSEHHLLFWGGGMVYFPRLAEAAIRSVTGRRGIDWSDGSYRSDELAAARVELVAREEAAEQLSTKIEILSRELSKVQWDRDSKAEFIESLAGKLPWMQTLTFADATLRRYVGKLLYPLRLASALTRKRLRPMFTPRLTHDAQYPPRPLPAAAEYRKTASPQNPPLISIVTPSFNQAPFIGNTIRSVLSQGYPRLEYIVQDGGSSDGTVEVLENVSHKLSHWESRSDEGQANAVNLGMSRSSGEILAYLNSDDLLLPGTLPYVARYFELHPDVDVVYGHRILIDTEGRDIGRWILPPHNSDVLRWADYVPQETLFWRRGIWEAIGGALDEDFHFALDWDLLLRFTAAGAHIVRLPRFLGAFRIHELQKNFTIGHVHGQDVRRLTSRTHGREVSGREIHKHVKPFFRRHYLCDRLHRLGFLRYGLCAPFSREPGAVEQVGAQAG